MELFLLLAAFAMVARGQDNVATVDLTNSTGSPQHLASGFIYGLPDTPNQIPDHFYTDIDFGYGRAGGAQLGAPARGWIWGIEEYRGRLASTLSNYNTCRKYGANFILLPHDVWGTDHANASTVWPGDGGDWTDYDNFVNQLLADLKANNALTGLVWDIWNEPDLTFFWKRSQAQWVELYVRTHKIIRADPSYSPVLISGPTLANLPMTNNTWWTSWAAAVKGNNTIPDQYVYHLEGGVQAPGDDLAYTNISLAALLNEYGLPDRQVNINEYATSPEQRPAGAAWWISRLERYNAIGLRGNWLSGLELHDLMANLLSKYDDPANYTATDYTSAAEFQVYKYYATNMTGNRVATEGSADALFDVYATVDPGTGTARVLAGSRVTAGSWNITVTGLPVESQGPSTLKKVHQIAFPGTSQWTIMEAPLDLGDMEVSVSGGQLILPVNTDNTTAWAFEFSIS